LKALSTEPPKPIAVAHPELKVPKNLEALVMRCLEKDPKLRPTNAQEIIQEIERVEREIAPPVEPSLPIAPITSPPAATPSPTDSPVAHASPVLPADPEAWPEGMTIRNKYRILAKVARRSTRQDAIYIILFKVLHLRSGRPAILEVVRSRGAEVDEIFKQNALLRLKVQHPILTRVIEVDECEDGRPFIVTEAVDGRGLEQVIKQEGPLAPLRACAIARQVAQGLAAVHSLGKIYGGVAPAGIKLIEGAGDDKIKLTDFGRHYLESAYRTRFPDLEADGIPPGQLYYLSPERISGKTETEADGRADIYPLGLVMYEMLTGELPYPKSSLSSLGALLFAILKDPPRPIHAVRPDLAIPDALASLVMRCLEKDPNLRPANAQELIHEIQQVEAGIQRPAALHPSPAVLTPAASPPKDSKVPFAGPGAGAPPAESDPWAEGQIIRGKYRVLEKLGMSGVLIFYKALQLQPEIVRAIEVKVDRSDDDSVQSARNKEIFQQSARERIKLQHPNVACAVEVDEAEDGRLYLVTEWVEGRSLERVMQQEGPLAPLRACAIARQVAAGLGAAHALGLVHGEVCPINISLLEDSEGETVKLVAFGASYVHAAIEAKFPTDTACPPRPYGSPEQLMGKRLSDLDGRSDLFSLGVILYQMLTGEKPFPGESYTGVVMATLTKQPNPIRTVRPDLAIPDSLGNLVMRCLEKDRNLRPASARELVQEIERIEGQM
jgi:serine/threonine protein kinase